VNAIKPLKDKTNLLLTVTTLAFLTQSCGQQQDVKVTRPGQGDRQGADSISEQHQYYSPSNNETQTEYQNTLMPAPADIAPIRPVPGQAIAYDFNGTLTRESPRAGVVRLILQSSPLNTAKKVRVKGNLINLRSSSVKNPIEKDVLVTSGGIVDFTVQNLTANTVYRLESVSVEDISTGSQQYSSTSVRDPYFLATTDGTALSKARRRLTLEALSEAYDWDNRNYDSRKQYASGWGWCDRFYTWAASREFKVSPRYGSTYFFRDYDALGDAKRIPTMGLTENLAGDLIRYEGTSEGTHTFMIVAYDQDTKQLWTVEGNYNSRVMRSKRNINSPWMHGHLTEEQIKQ